MNRPAHADGDPSFGALILFWLPLALMWLVMGIEMPVISAFLSRLAQPKLSLASFEVAMAVAMLLQSPVVHMLSAATAVARGARSFAHLHTVLGRLVLGLTAAHALVCIPPVFRFIVVGILGAPQEITPAANLAAALMLPLPAGVGYRRLYQGAMIRAGMTGAVSLVMVVRLVFTVAVLAAGLFVPALATVPGYVTAAAAFSAGIVSGGVAAWLVFRARVAPGLDPHEPDPWNLRRMSEFYLPLALTSLIVMTSRPLITFAIARAEAPLDSLAAWPVMQGYLFMFTAIAYSFQEVVIAHTRADRAVLTPVVRRLGVAIASLLLGTFLLNWVTGVTAWWYRSVVGVPGEIFDLAHPATILLLPVLAVAVLNAVNGGLLVARRATRFITIATVANMAVHLAMAYLVPALTDMTGARLAALIVVGSMSMQALVLLAGVRRGHRTRTDVSRRTPAATA